MTGPPSDPSARFEPHLRDVDRFDPVPEGGSSSPPAPEGDAGYPRPAGAPPSAEDEATPPDGSVWEEPALSPDLAGPVPPEAATYGKWLRLARERMPAGRTWFVTAAVAVLAGPWAVLGAFLGLESAAAGLLVVVVFGPVLEEVLKVSAALVVVERRPHLFSSAGQIATCAFASGLVFAAIENALYLGVYIPDPDPGIVLWRWTACVALHSGCSLLAGIGVARVWRDVWERLDRPRLQLAFPSLVLAASVHGTYNALATVWALVQGR